MKLSLPILAAGLLAVSAVAAPVASANHDVTTRVSFGPDGGNGAFPANYRALSADGSRVFFSTDESLITGDTDSSTDIYGRTGSTTTLISQGAAACQPGCGNAATNVTFRDISTDGTRVFFTTTESLD